MTAFLRIYDNVTSNKYVSMGITISSTACSLYSLHKYINYTQPLYLITHLCAGAIIACLSKIYLVHNIEVKNKTERNNIYSTLSLISWYTLGNGNFMATRVNGFIMNSLSFLNSSQYPIWDFTAH